MTGRTHITGVSAGLGPERVAAVDSQDMRRRIEGFPGDQVEAAGRAARFAGALEGRRPRAVAGLGMGGSALAGDRVGAATRARSRPRRPAMRALSWLPRIQFGQ